MEIKVGQVWKRHRGKKKFVITNYKPRSIRYNDITVVWQNGCFYDYPCWEFTPEEVVEDYDLIATYPTWQEAVNSKEFKGE